MRFFAGVSLLYGVGGCASEPVEVRSAPHAALIASHHFAEGDTGKKPASEAGRTAASESPSQEVAVTTPTHGDLPDPPALSERVQHEFTLHYMSGDISVVRIRTVELERPLSTPRRMGRFAIELWIGKELIERVRFDFPLLAASPAPNEQKAGEPGLAARANVTHVVSVPHSPRATRAHLVDRATGEVVVIPWPPESSTPSSDAPPLKAP